MSGAKPGRKIGRCDRVAGAAIVRSVVAGEDHGAVAVRAPTPPDRMLGANGQPAVRVAIMLFDMNPITATSS